MGIGKKFAPEVVREQDPDTGAWVSRLTGYRANCNHLYFTNNSFYDHNTKMVVCGDRDNASNFFSIDLKTFEITQLTELPVLPYPQEYVMLEGIVDPVRNYCYFFAGTELKRLDLMNYELITIYTIPEGYRKHIVSCGRDSEYIYTSIYEDVTANFQTDTQHGYIGFDKIAEAKPLSKILKVRYDGSSAECIREEKCWIAHVNVSPTNPDWITYCHEGPWHTVDHRIWGMDTRTGEVWKIHETKPGEVVGHEYWYQDGVHIGYHGTKADGSKVMGRICFDNTDNQETVFPYNTGHIYSRDVSLIVGDGNAEGKYVRVWKWNGTGYDAPRALCQHFSSFKDQNTHVHPAISPDGRNVIFTSDRTGYNQVYWAEIPEDVDSLPLLEKYSKL